VTGPLTIGRFRVERSVGVGAFSTVWLARDEDLDAWVAVKVLAEAWSRNQDARRRFTEEARALRHLDSDRIVRVYELGWLDEDRPYMVMEYADRGSLEDRMRFAREAGRPSTVGEAAAVGIELAACLTSVHALRIVHRDVKPSNVLFRSVAPEVREALNRSGRRTGDERMLLGDFGIARRMEAAGHTMVVGSPQYMAPEQADPRRAHRVDGRADVFAAAVVLFEVLTGTNPWPSEPPTPGVVTAGAQSVRDVRDLRPDVPDAMADVIHRALATDADERQSSAWELRDELVASLGRPSPVAAPAARSAVRDHPVPRPAIPHQAAPLPAPGEHATRVLSPTRTVAEPPVVMVPPAPAPHHDAAAADEDGWEDETIPSIGPLDAGVLATVAGGLLAVAAVLPWAAGAGPAAAFPSGLSLRAGTVAFACGGAILFAALIRMAARGRRSLALVRALALVAAATALATFAFQVLTAPGVLSRLFSHGLQTNLGIGLWLVPVGAALGLLAAVRAGWQLRDLDFQLRQDVPPGVL
jgi:serine/threonine protein kinase